MKILVIAGDFWHPMEVVRRGIENMHLDPAVYQFDFIEDAKDIMTKELLDESDLVVFAKANVIGSYNTAKMFEPGNAALAVADYQNYVENGKAILSVHAGNTVDQADWQAFVGNRFIRHPARCDVRVYPTQQHPITNGAGEFTEIDEHYILGDIAQDIDVFLQSDSAEGGTQIAGYTKIVGEGKVCVLTPGHTMNAWGNPEFVKIFKNAIDWCVD